MHHHVYVLVIIIASFQALAWVTRKYLLKDKRLDINAIKLFESFIISGFLITYILSTTNMKDIKDSYKLMGWWHFMLMCITGICVVITVTLVFHLLREIDVSVLQPTTSIARIIILTIVAMFLFKENITSLKIISLLLMTGGVGLMMYADEKN
jgi:drug/metabolite transporter (DMT)-like permease